MTKINDFDPRLLNIDEVSFMGDELILYDINYVNYVTYFVLFLIM